MFTDFLLAEVITLHGLVIAFAILLYVTTSHVMRQRRQPSAAIAWILFILLVPYLALPIYLLFGSRKLARPGPPALLPPVPRGRSSWAVETILALGQPAPAAYFDLDIHADGAAAREALFDTIGAARRSIDLCTFILAHDPFGDAVLDALCRKAREGVRVRLLLDGLGNLMSGRPKLGRISEAGGQSTLFVRPLLSPLKGRTNLRNHRKLLLADAQFDAARMWSGGRNLAEEYFEGTRRAAPWRDLSFCVQGPLVRQAAQVFEHDWAFANGRRDVTYGDGAAAASVEAGAQLVASGPDQVDDTVYALLVAAAYQARHSIALVTPYFVPEAALLMALCLAARRGVGVDLLLPGRSNHRLSDMARSRALRALMGAGARVWLAPDMVHAKLVVIDEALALAGSANLDNRSLFLNYELMFAFHNAADIRRFAAWFEREREGARPYVATPPGLMRDVAEGTLLWLGFQL